MNIFCTHLGTEFFKRCRLFFSSRHPKGHKTDNMAIAAAQSEEIDLLSSHISTLTP
jgi:hypothetical protein